MGIFDEKGNINFFGQRLAHMAMLAVEEINADPSILHSYEVPLPLSLVPRARAFADQYAKLVIMLFMWRARGMHKFAQLNNTKLARCFLGGSFSSRHKL